MDSNRNDLDALLKETRQFEASEKFKGNAIVRDRSIYDEASKNRLTFWESWAENLKWREKWHTILEWKPPYAKWFLGGKLNVSENCLDRHLEAGRSDKMALIWEGENGDSRSYTYRDLHAEVCKLANSLKSLGVKKGDRVVIYLPMIPEAAIAMLACARIGAPHSVVFGGFSPQSLVDRINDLKAVCLITADGGYRRGGVVPLKTNADKALDSCPTVKKVIVVARLGQPTEEFSADMEIGRDHWYHELIGEAEPHCTPEIMDAEDLLFVLYTSGTTGKPKGIVHTTGGYLTQVTATTKCVFDLQEDDVYWCTADVGWITGHSYIVYGPMSNGASVLMYEGAPDWPDKGRFWEICQKYKVSIFYTAPTAIRAFMKWGDDWVQKYDLSSLRLLGTVGEPINPEAWIWYHRVIGKERCPIVDTWWQTETGAIMITSLPAVTETRPGSAGEAFPGICTALLNDEGEAVSAGLLAITEPWPSMLRTIYGDDERYESTYWSKWEGIYFAGDGAKIDEDGFLSILGRVDDVLNTAGHRIGTMEVESALVDHPAVAEAAVVGKFDEVKGQAIAAFVTLKENWQADDGLVMELRDHVAKKIGAIARPDSIVLTADLPKTRSGKIMRRLLKDIAEGKALGDTTTLADPSVVQGLKEQYLSKES
ncbi:MAG: acetate--CoA ligase [Longimicrobiales bacterium]|nr:acetate--CoA ligase [Longimicrobiales bacterium]|tara:strand:- start:2106 stop:4064 length:1959 start_codon:yes stop_codon:yes gene_type:complete